MSFWFFTKYVPCLGVPGGVGAGVTVVAVLAVVGGAVVLTLSAIHVLSVTREIKKKHEINRARNLETNQLASKNTIRSAPDELRSFPGMYASSLMLEKVTVSPLTPKVLGLIQR